MKKTILISFLTLFQFSFSQIPFGEYSKLIKKADSLYNIKDYKNSALEYSNTFKKNNWKASTNDRYNAACSWALANVSDSSFYHLNRLAEKSNYTNIDHITADTDLNSLHNDKRWNPLLKRIKKNKEEADAKLNKPLVAVLDSIYNDDQNYRVQSDEVSKKYGVESKEVNDLWKIINKKDSINLIKTCAIIDKYGWLGSDVIGPKGNSTLFLVIQHSDLKTQEKYLPIMREAVKNKKASSSSLALLEDRVALGEGKKQIYGSQMAYDSETKKYYVQLLDDPDNVDKRRAEVGLGLLSEYVNIWDVKWDVEQYKKDLPKYELLLKEMNIKYNNK